MALVPCLQAGSQYGDFCFSDDSKYLFCCCGSVVKVYNTNSGECIRDLKAHAHTVTGVHVNPGNVLQVISCGQDGLLIYWDYLDGVKLKEFNLHIPLHGILSVNAEKKSLMMVAQTSEHKKTFSLMRWRRLKPSYNEFDKPKMLLEQCPRDLRLISFGCSKEIVASALAHKVTVYSLEKESTTLIKDKDKFNQNKAVTCVACHPKEYIIACGYESGKIILWHNILQANPVSSLRHWHALPVLCLGFSVDGSILLSGGHECVLVRWQMNNAHQKDFKPRMGAPVTHVLTSPDGSMYASRHSDNVVQLLNINLKVLQMYRGLTRSNMGLHCKKNPIPSGLHFDPRSQALVTNGLPGHLQFYSLTLHKQLFNLDIVGQNYISPENMDRPKVITEVTASAISDDGAWLATFESWDDGYFTPELRLKFWMWSSEAQTYCLNTTVEYPHDNQVTSLLFRPHRPSSKGNIPTLVTVGTDLCFKLWTLVDDSDIYRDNTKWNCVSVGEYRCLEAQGADFSSDASVLAVGFGHLLTLWDPDSNVVKTTLSQSLAERQQICAVKFGSHSCRHHVVVATQSTLLVWDLLSLKVTWSIPQDHPMLFKDPSSDLMGFITDSMKLSVFRPSSPNVLYTHPKVSASPVLGAVFVPEGRALSLAGQGWPGCSQVYLFNAEEELITFDLPGRELERTPTVKIAQNLPERGLSNLIAEKLVREGSNETRTPSFGENLTQSQQEAFMATILHSNEPVSLHCNQYLQNFLVKRKPVKMSTEDTELSGDDQSEEESDMETDQGSSKPMQASIREADSEAGIETQVVIKEKLLSQPQPADWVQWCAALRLK